MVEWAKPSTASKLQLCYQLCYYKIQEKVGLHSHTFKFTIIVPLKHTKWWIWCPISFRNVLSKTFQWAPHLWLSCKPFWSHPRTTRSKSGLLSSPDTILTTVESLLNGRILWAGHQIRVTFWTNKNTYAGLTSRFQPFFVGITSCCSLYWLRGKHPFTLFSVPTVTVSPTTLIYLATIAFVTAVFFTLYRTIPACRRSFIYLWCTVKHERSSLNHLWVSILIKYLFWLFINNLVSFEPIGGLFCGWTRFPLQAKAKSCLSLWWEWNFFQFCGTNQHLCIFVFE